MLVQLEKSALGCYFEQYFAGIISYADDLLIFQAQKRNFK